MLLPATHQAHGVLKIVRFGQLDNDVDMIREPAGVKVRLLVWQMPASRFQPNRNDLLDLIDGADMANARQLIWVMGTEEWSKALEAQCLEDVPCEGTHIPGILFHPVVPLLGAVRWKETLSLTIYGPLQAEKLVALVQQIQGFLDAVQRGEGEPEDPRYTGGEGQWVSVVCGAGTALDAMNGGITAGVWGSGA